MNKLGETDNTDIFKYVIYFDLNVHALEAYYPYKNEDHGETVYTNAYRDIAKFLKESGFVRQQGSGYISEKDITQLNIHTVIDEWAQKMPWLVNCFEKLDITIAGKEHDLTEFFKTQVNRLQDHIINKKTNADQLQTLEELNTSDKTNPDLTPKRRAINFDINQNLLKENYPYSSRIHSPYAYKKAYGLIAKYMKSVGFSHRQYSGYLSDNEIPIIKAEIVILGLAQKMPWLKECVNNIELTSVVATHDMTAFFKEHALMHLQNKEQTIDSKKCLGVHHTKNDNQNSRV